MLKKDLLKQAKELGIRGRTKMTKQELVDAIKKAGGDVDDDKKDDKKEMKQAKIDEMYKTKVDTPPVKKVVKKPKMSSSKMTQVQQKMKEVAADSKRPKMSQKMQQQLKNKMAEVQAEKK